ncbi:MAG: SLC13 family permease, partial [Candidatus Hodarchaeota archaeon]
IGFIDFIVVSLPFLMFTIPISIYYLRIVFPPEKIPLSDGAIDTEMILDLDEWGVIDNLKSFYLAWIALVGTIVGFALSDQIGVPIGVIAISGGVIATLLTRADETRLIRSLNWDTLLFFAGLFVLVGILEDTGVLEDLALSIRNLSGGDLFLSGFLILIITAFFSGILDNIPVTAALIPVVDEISQGQPNNPNFLWFVLVFSGTLGGGWTPFGSAASILVISILLKENRPLDFKHFIKVFLPISLILLALSGIYLSILAIFNII